MLDSKYSRRVKKRLKFTLIEMICVLAVAALMIGFVSSKIGFIPAFVNFKDSVVHIERVFSSAAALSASSGERVTIVYKNNSFSSPTVKNNSQINYIIPSFISVDVGNNNFNNLKDHKFYFFPDGSASGPDINLSYKGHTAKIVISKLTGYPIVKID